MGGGNWTVRPRRSLYGALALALLVTILLALIGSSASSQAATTATGTRYEQTDSRLSYAGTWTSFSKTGLASGNSYTRANAPGSSVTIVFRGEKLDWIAMKGTTTGKADVYLDGKAMGTVDLASRVAIYQQRVWSTGILTNGLHTVKISRSATNIAGKYIAVDAVEVAGTLIASSRVEQDDSRLAYAGTWASGSSSYYSAGSQRYTNASGAAVAASFSGTSLTWIARTDPSGGTARVTLDGTATFTVDLYSAGALNKQRVWSSGALAPGNHSVKIERTGQKNAKAQNTYVYVDAFDVVETLTQTSSSSAADPLPTTTTTVPPATTTTTLPTTTTTTALPPATTTTLPATTTTLPATTTTTAPSTSTTLPSTGKTYYIDATGGSDTNNGTSVATPWKSISKVKSTHFNAGDWILFKRGSTWREPFTWEGTNTSQGTAGNPITFGAYGSGAKPRLTISADLSDPNSWAYQGSNIWRAGAAYGSNPKTIASDVGALIFNNDTSVGAKKAQGTTLTTQGQYFYNYTTTRYLQMYSVGNPGTVYSHIEAAMKGDTRGGCGGNSLVGPRSYITFQNIDFRYIGWNGLTVVRGDHIIIEDCDFSFCGGSYESEGSGNRDGNGLMLSNGITNSTVRNNTFTKIHEVALSVQAWGATVQNTSNLYLYGNTIADCKGGGFEMWWSSTTLASTISNVYFCNNVLYNVAGGILETEDPEYNQTMVKWAVNGGTLAGYPTHTISNVVIKNNIGHTVTNSAMVGCMSDMCTGFVGVAIDYNCWYPTGTYAYRWTKEGGGVNWSEWQSTYRGAPHDQHGLNVDPKFVDPANGDFRLAAGSPCINAGGAVAGLGAATLGTAPDMGAYEKQ